MNNQGAEALRKTGLSVRQIAEQLGLKAGSQVHRWLKCTETPSTQRRVQIEAAWSSVRAHLWDLPAGASTASIEPAAVAVAPVASVAPRPVAPPAPAEEEPFAPPLPPWPPLVRTPPPVDAPASSPPAGPVGSVLEEALGQVERLRRMQREAEIGDTALSVRVAIERELRNALAQLAEMRGELSPSDEARILQSDAWGRIVQKITDVVRLLPERCTRVEVAEAFARALAELDAPAPPA